MNTKTLALIIVFAALTIALNVAGPKIPAPYAPFLYYQVWEIPIVIAFLMLGPASGIIIAAINTGILVVVFPGPLLLGPVYNLIAVLSMLLGVYLPYKVGTRNREKEDLAQFLKAHTKMISILATALGIIVRVAVTTVTNYFFIQQSPPVGFSYSPSAALAFLPLSAIFNATVALYTVPIAIVVVAAVASRYKI